MPRRDGGEVMKLDLDTIRSPKYDANRDRFGGGEHGDCIICGKAIRNPGKAKYAAMTIFGELFTDDERIPPEYDQGGFPIGPDCYRKHRDVLKPFIGEE